MPEPLLYMQSMGTAAVVSALCVLALAARGRRLPRVRRGIERGQNLADGRVPDISERLNSACILAMGCGIAAGCAVLRWRFDWPPASGLDRLLTIVIPATLGIELIAGCQRVRPTVAWSLRLILAAAISRILLHNSIYLTDSASGWTPWQAGTMLAAGGTALSGLWILLAWLSRRSRSGVSIACALCLATVCGGLAVMLAGYIKGGAAAFPLAAALAAATLAARLIAPRLAPAIIGLGVVELFGVVFIGHFYGRLSTGCALATLLAPLLCWMTEILPLRNRSPRLVGSLRLLLVAIPLLAVLNLAKRDFDQKMAPMLGIVGSTTFSSEFCVRAGLSR